MLVRLKVVPKIIPAEKNSMDVTEGSNTILLPVRAGCPEYFRHSVVAFFSPERGRSGREIFKAEEDGCHYISSLLAENQQHPDSLSWALPKTEKATGPC